MILIAEFFKVSNYLAACLKACFLSYQVIIFAIFQFFLLQFAGILLCSIIQSIIRSVIVSVFLHRFLIMFDRPRAARLTFIIYCTTLCLFDIILASSLFWGSIGVTCNKHNEWRPKVLIVVDSLQGILLITIYIMMLRKKKEDK